MRTDRGGGKTQHNAEAGTAELRLGRRIWARYGNSPGVLRIRSALRSGFRASNFGAERLSLLAEIQRRWTGTSALPPEWSRLIYAWPVSLMGGGGSGTTPPLPVVRSARPSLEAVNPVLRSGATPPGPGPLSSKEAGEPLVGGLTASTTGVGIEPAKIPGAESLPSRQEPQALGRSRIARTPNSTPRAQLEANGGSGEARFHRTTPQGEGQESSRPHTGPPLSQGGACTAKEADSSVAGAWTTPAAALKTSPSKKLEAASAPSEPGPRAPDRLEIVGPPSGRPLNATPRIQPEAKGRSATARIHRRSVPGEGQSSSLRAAEESPTPKPKSSSPSPTSVFVLQPATLKRPADVQRSQDVARRLEPSPAASAQLRHPVAPRVPAELAPSKTSISEGSSSTLSAQQREKGSEASAARVQSTTPPGSGPSLEAEERGPAPSDAQGEIATNRDQAKTGLSRHWIGGAEFGPGIFKRHIGVPPRLDVPRQTESAAAGARALERSVEPGPVGQHAFPSVPPGSTSVSLTPSPPDETRDATQASKVARTEVPPGPKAGSAGERRSRALDLGNDLFWRHRQTLVSRLIQRSIRRRAPEWWQAPPLQLAMQNAVIGGAGPSRDSELLSEPPAPDRRQAADMAVTVSRTVSRPDQPLLGAQTPAGPLMVATRLGGDLATPMPHGPPQSFGSLPAHADSQIVRGSESQSPAGPRHVRRQAVPRNVGTDAGWLGEALVRSVQATPIILGTGRLASVPGVPGTVPSLLREFSQPQMKPASPSREDEKRSRVQLGTESLHSQLSSQASSRTAQSSSFSWSPKGRGFDSAAGLASPLTLPFSRNEGTGVSLRRRDGAFHGVAEARPFGAGSLTYPHQVGTLKSSSSQPSQESPGSAERALPVAVRIQRTATAPWIDSSAESTGGEMPSGGSALHAGAFGNLIFRRILGEWGAPSSAGPARETETNQVSIEVLAEDALRGSWPDSSTSTFAVRHSNTLSRYLWMSGSAPTSPAGAATLPKRFGVLSSDPLHAVPPGARIHRLASSAGTEGLGLAVAVSGGNPSRPPEVRPSSFLGQRATQVQRATSSSAFGVGVPMSGPPIAAQLPGAAPRTLPGFDIAQLADQVYHLLVRRIASERDRRGI